MGANKSSPNQSCLSDQLQNFNSQLFPESSISQCSSIDTNFSHPNHVNIFPPSNDTYNFLKNLTQEQLLQLSQIATDQFQMPVTFHWIHGGNQVKLAGTFSKWTYIPMDKVGNEFVVTIPLPKGRHQYKFNVDEKWICASEQPIEPDQNQKNMNNVIEVQGVNLSEILSQNSLQSFTQPSLTDQLSQNNFLQQNYQMYQLYCMQNQFQFQQQNQMRTEQSAPQNLQTQSLAQNFEQRAQQSITQNASQQQQYQQSPIIVEPNQQQTKSQSTEKLEKPGNKNQSHKKQDPNRPPQLPPHLKSVYFLNHKEVQTGNLWDKMNPQNKQQFDPSESVIRYIENSNTLLQPNNVTLNHIGTQIVSTNNYQVYSITQRFKGKFATIKYYTLKSNDN